MLGDGVDFSFSDMSDWREAFGYATNPSDGEAGAMLILAVAALTGGIWRYHGSIQQGSCSKKGLKGVWTSGSHTLDGRVYSNNGLEYEGDLYNWIEYRRVSDFSIRRSTSGMDSAFANFFIASGIAFATGTSFGTMGISR